MSANKKLKENFLSLLIVQGLNYVLPLLTLPYLFRVLGPAHYGSTTFAVAFIQFFVILTDYGFNLSATKEISIHAQQKKKVQSIFSSVLFIKTVLMIISFIAVFIIVSLTPRFQEDFWLYMTTFSLVIGNVLFPIWFFQGMEKMKFITILNIISKTVYTICIFVFVNQAEDYLLVNLFQGISIIIVGIISIFIIRFSFSIPIQLPKINEIKYQLREGWHVFLSTVAISLYTISNTFFLGLLTNPVIVGYYSSVEKLINAANGLIGVFGQTVYPHISKLASTSKKEALEFTQKVFKYVFGASLLLSTFIFLLAPFIVNIVIGEGYEESINVLRILALLPFLIALSNVFGLQTMLPFGYNRAFSNILIFSSGLNVILTFIFVPFLQHIGTAISVVTTEFIVTLFMYTYLKSKNITFIGGKHV
ncbi:flippase [Bacillus sp. V5-8f]|uniref:flippase n=1 Tax=Bacillus sp. V5-8f TaxID=2053044 RepID=UPI000C760F6D|nr:flippase [Bacillus sp. V5-8f]PLT35761.1 flippase [Bacillus sp. V5-8f]